jgi:predicted metal-binding membrane protein
VSPLQTARKHPEVVAALLVAAGLAWWWTAEQMAGMDGAPGADLGTLGWFTGSWAVMMAAMMLPSFGPTLAVYATPGAGAGRAGRAVLFGLGYLLVWTVVGVLAYAGFELGKSLLGSDLAWHNGGRWLSGGLVAVAAAYQFVPLKRACLTRCRGHLAKPPANRAHGPAPALVAGARSGIWCVGCSWALMIALFALGVMSVTWMIVIAALVALEKTSPWPLTARLSTAAVLVVLAVGILAAPHHVPGLILPSTSAMHGMQAMGSR